MRVFPVWRDGVRRVNGAPAVLLGVWAMTLAVSLPLTLVLRGMIVQHLDDSLAADTAVSGVNYDWMQEFADQAGGVGVTFKPTIIGFAAVLDNLSAFLDDTARPVVIVSAASLYIALWLVAAGGIIDRYARDRHIGTHGFFAAGGVFGIRFLRLAIVQWMTYALLFSAVHHWLFNTAFPRLTHETNVERNAFLVRVALYGGFGLLLATCNLVFDYAKVRAVVEDRRSMLGAVGAAVRFVTHNGASAGLFAIDFAMFVLIVALYAIVAPGAGGTGIRLWSGFAISQLYVLGRLWVKLVFWASEIALFQSRLAHAGYVMRPLPTWPESPAAEAIVP